MTARVTKTRDGEGWRRARCGKGDLQASIIVDDRARQICILDSWIPVEKIPNLIAALEVARDTITKEDTARHTSAVTATKGTNA